MGLSSPVGRRARTLAPWMQPTRARYRKVHGRDVSPRNERSPTRRTARSLTGFPKGTCERAGFCEPSPMKPRAGRFRLQLTGRTIMGPTSGGCAPHDRGPQPRPRRRKDHGPADQDGRRARLAQWQRRSVRTATPRSGVAWYMACRFFPPLAKARARRTARSDKRIPRPGLRNGRFGPFRSPPARRPHGDSRGVSATWSQLDRRASRPRAPLSLWGGPHAAGVAEGSRSASPAPTAGSRSRIPEENLRALCFL